MIDWDRVNALREEVGPEAFAEVVDLFLEEVDEKVAQISAGRGGTAEEDMHFLKGAAINLGFSDLGALCSASETLARSGQAEEIDLAAVFDCFEASRDSFLQAANAKAMI